MSAYENYSRTSSVYDATRSAVGVETILGCLATGRGPVHEQVLLDAGCGTGNYARALVDHVRHLEGVDLNPGMLEQARAKLEQPLREGRARVQQGDLTALPLPDASADAVMVNQVLHHLPDTAPAGWPLRARVFGELFRVLRPGGSLVVNTCLPRQLREGYWFAALVPRAIESMVSRHQDYPDLTATLRDAGFQVRGRIVPLDVVLQGEHYFDTRGPQREEWRSGDSVWADVSAAELGGALERLAALHDGGEMADFMLERERLRTLHGQITFVHAVRTHA